MRKRGYFIQQALATLSLHGPFFHFIFIFFIYFFLPFMSFSSLFFFFSAQIFSSRQAVWRLGLGLEA